MKTIFKQRLYLLFIVSLLLISLAVLASTPASECASTLTQKFQLSRAQAPELDNASIYDFKVIFHFKLV